jgi:hypothetical protein
LKANTPVATNDVARKAEIDTVTGDISAHAALTNAHGASATPATDKIAMYDEGGRLQANTPVVAADVARKTETDALATADSVHAALTNPHSATATPTASRIAMYDSAKRLKSGAAPSAATDCARKTETDALTAALNAHAALTNPHSATSAATGSRIAMRDSGGDLIARMFRMTYTSTAQGAYFVGMTALGASNNYLRPMTIAQATAALGYLSSKAASGYQKLPGGVIIQWGTVTRSSTAQTLTFPLAFPTACLNVQVTDISGDTAGGLSATSSIISGTITKTQVRFSTSTSANYLSWVAIGY